MEYIQTYIDHLFSDLPISKQNRKAKHRTIQLYNETIEALEAEKTFHEALAFCIEHYGTIKQIELVLDLKVDTEETVSLKQYRLLIMTIIFFSVLIAGTITYLIYTLIMIVSYFNTLSFHIIKNCVFTFVIASLLIILARRIQKKYIYQVRWITRKNVYQRLQTMFAVHQNKLIHSIMILNGLLMLYIILIKYVYQLIPFSSFLLYGVSLSMILLFGVLFILKNSFILKGITHIMDEPFDYQRVKIICKISCLYITIFLILSIIIDVVSYMLFMYVLGISYIVVCLWVDKQFIRDLFIHTKFYKKRVILFMVAIIVSGIFSNMVNGSWFLQPYISSIPSIEHKDNKIVLNDDGSFSIYNSDDKPLKILQLTDIHIGGSAMSIESDRKALESIYQLIQRTTPDLIIITGDFVFPVGVMSYSFNNYTPMLQFASFMRNIGIPWSFTYGNHDTEPLATHNQEEIIKMYTSLSFKNTGNLLYNPVQPNIHGRSNQVIKLYTKDNQLDQVLFLMDSNAYRSGMVDDYDNIHQDQVDWYTENIEKLKKENGNTPKSLLFFHIPLKQYEEAYQLYKKNSNQVTYYYGEIGEKDEAICYSKYPSTLFDEIIRLQSTKGVFVGHDHYNTLSIKYKGVRLTYGMSIDYLVMPGISSQTKQRGGTLITMPQDGTFSVTPIPLTDNSILETIKY